MPIEPDALEACFARRAQSLAGEIEREMVALDGNTNDPNSCRVAVLGASLRLKRLVGGWAPTTGGRE